MPDDSIYALGSFGKLSFLVARSVCLLVRSRNPYLLREETVYIYVAGLRDRAANNVLQRLSFLV